jgi:hypothetical protein
MPPVVLGIPHAIIKDDVAFEFHSSADRMISGFDDHTDRLVSWPKRFQVSIGPRGGKRAGTFRREWTKMRLEVEQQWSRVPEEMACKGEYYPDRNEG